MTDTNPPSSEPSTGEPSAAAARLKQLIEQAGNLLPITGPITAFAFLNTLQALEDLPFDEGLCKGARLFGNQPYLAEERYRERMVQGRIQLGDIAEVLKQDLGDRGNEPLGDLGSRYDLRLAMLRYPLRTGPVEELRWFVAETDALSRFREETPPAVRKHFIDETRHWVMRDLRHGRNSIGGVRNDRVYLELGSLLERLDKSSIERWSEPTWEAFTLQSIWRICRAGSERVPAAAAETPSPRRHRNVLLEATHEDSDVLVHEVLIRFCAAFTDQGFANWALPHREQGFFRSFFAMYQNPGGPPESWLRELPAELSRISAANISPVDSILESLELLGVSPDEWDEFIPATVLALRGWAGLIYQMEIRSDRVPFPVTPGTLAEFLAVRLILERVALSYLARRTLQYEGSLKELRDVAILHPKQQKLASPEQRAFQAFQLAQVMNWLPQNLCNLSPQDWELLYSEIDSFGGLARRKLFHRAFERNFRIRALDAIALHWRKPIIPRPRPRFQAVFCIDAREESFRRHIEEVAPDTETFGAAGFFGVAMYYRGVADAHFSALCPIVVRPLYWITEEVTESFEVTNRRRAQTRRVIGAASHQVHVGSRSVAGGAILTASLGVLASIPLVARVLFPRLTARIRRTANRFFEPPGMTRLRLERKTPKPGSAADEIGLSLEEMANIGERMLREFGISSYSRLIMFLGHGSFCLNNPHKSAYDCGACTGNAGGPNARALAAILNDPRVREMLVKRGLTIPADTVFIGGLHNTCDDTVKFLDVDLLPPSHQPDLEAAKATLEKACERNAHERCRRFQSAPLDISLAAAKRHVEGRSEDLAQVRPEFGNASNAMCFVGRRDRVRGLYLDRRSFLTSYDSTKDDDKQTVLLRILSAVVPVCEGINMQYFLSYVDSPGWGCGTKLPHNVTSLLGVMDGAASDLRPGLPWQGVEIHEPVRCLFVIETTTEAMISIMNRNPVVSKILRNGWAQLAVLDPHSAEIQVFHNNQFYAYQPEAVALPTAPGSIDWYRGWRDHLGFAEIIGKNS